MEKQNNEYTVRVRMGKYVHERVLNMPRSKSLRTVYQRIMTAFQKTLKQRKKSLRNSVNSDFERITSVRVIDPQGKKLGGSRLGDRYILYYFPGGKETALEQVSTSAFSLCVVQ